MAQMNRGDEHLTGRELGSAGQPSMSAHDLLDDDHNRVLQLFNKYENTRATASPAEKNRLVREICRELKIHAAIEEEIYYPRVIEKADVDDRVEMAQADHARVEELIKQVEGASTENEAFDELIATLDSEVRHHISEERSNLFDVAEVMGINTPEIARRLYNRKEELKREVH